MNKYYTEEEVRSMLENMGTYTEESIDYFISEMDSVELPNWDDIRNKMTPFNTLIILTENMIENGLMDRFDIEIRDMLNSEIIKCKKYINQLKQ